MDQTMLVAPPPEASDHVTLLIAVLQAYRDNGGTEFAAQVQSVQQWLSATCMATAVSQPPEWSDLRRILERL